MTVILLGFLALIACGVLFLLGFVAPRTSKRAQRKVDHVLEDARNAALELPRPVGGWLAKPFTKSEKAADESTSAGRKSRSRTHS